MLYIHTSIVYSHATIGNMLCEYTKIDEDTAGAAQRWKTYNLYQYLLIPPASKDVDDTSKLLQALYLYWLNHQH